MLEMNACGAGDERAFTVENVHTLYLAFIAIETNAFIASDERVLSSDEHLVWHLRQT